MVYLVSDNCVEKDALFVEGAFHFLLVLPICLMVVMWVEETEKGREGVVIRKFGMGKAY